MNNNQQSPFVAHCMKEHLLGKVGRFIQKRQSLIGNMNKFCLVKTTHVIQETNRQLPSKAVQSTVTNIQERNPQKFDSMMSVPEANVTTTLNLANQSFYSFSSKSEDKKTHRQMRNRRQTIVYPSGEGFTLESRRQISSINNNSSEEIQNSELIPLPGYQQEEEEEKYVEILRMTKKYQMQEQERERKRLIEEANRIKSRIDYSNTRVMFDYDCKVMRMGGQKVRNREEIYQMKGEVDQRQRVQKSSFESQRYDIKSPKNITQKEIQFEQSKVRKSLRARTEEEEKHPSLFIKINHEAHKETEGAFVLGGEGIKIKIQNRQLSQKRSSLNYQTSITRRLSKKQYYEFKKDEETKKRRILFKIKSEENKRIQSQEKAKPEMLEQSNVKKSNSHKRITLARKTSASNQSRIIVLNPMMCTDLLRQELVQKSQFSEEQPTNMTENKSRRDQMSSIDRYNLVYTKHNGNPPIDTRDVTKELKMSTKRSMQSRVNPVIEKKSKKFSWVANNRLISNRNQQSRRIKTQI